MNAGRPVVIRAAEQPESWFDEGCFITEWLNSAVDPALSVARARVPPGHTTRWHRLVETTERYVILAGRGRVSLREASVQNPGGEAVAPPDAQRQAGAYRPTAHDRSVAAGTAAGAADADVGGTGLTAEVGPGDVVVIPAGMDQRITNAGGEDLVFLAICTPRFQPLNYRDTDDGH